MRIAPRAGTSDTNFSARVADICYEDFFGLPGYCQFDADNKRAEHLIKNAAVLGRPSYLPGRRLTQVANLPVPGPTNHYPRAPRNEKYQRRPTA